MLDKESLSYSSPNVLKEQPLVREVSIFSEMPTYREAVRDILKISLP